MDANHCHCAALRQASRRVTRLYDEVLAPVDLGINQFSILARLDRLGPLALHDLARALTMDRSTIGHLLRPLEDRGLVTLTVDAGDGRRRLACLTSAGQALLTEARPLWVAAQARYEQFFGPDRARALRTVLSDLVALPADATPLARSSVPGPGSSPVRGSAP